MIVDFHTHYTGGKLFGTKYRSPEAVIEQMKSNDIEINLLLPLDALVFQTINENDIISNWVSQYPDHFAGLGTLHPRLLEEATKEMVRCLSELRIIGFKFHPWLQAFSPLESAFMELAEEANRLKTMFFFHDGTPPYSEPFQIAEIAEKNPDLTVVMGHAGLNDLWRESLAAAKKYDNVWLCFSACPHWGMKEIVKEVDSERLLWGSDYPLANVMDTKNRIREVERLPISEQMKEKILYSNAKKLLGRFR